MFRLTRKAQSTAEYAIVIALVIGAVVAMQVYVRRGLQGRMKGGVDEYLIGRTSDASVNGTIPKIGTGLYEPEYTERVLTQIRNSTTYENVSTLAGEEGKMTRGITGEEVTKIEPGAYEKYKAPPE